MSKGTPTRTEQLCTARTVSGQVEGWAFIKTRFKALPLPYKLLPTISKAVFCLFLGSPGFFCSSIPVVLLDNAGDSKCLNTLFLLSHICFIESLSMIYFLPVMVHG